MQLRHAVETQNPHLFEGLGREGDGVQHVAVKEEERGAALERTGVIVELAQLVQVVEREALRGGEGACANGQRHQLRTRENFESVVALRLAREAVAADNDASQDSVLLHAQRVAVREGAVADLDSPQLREHGKHDNRLRVRSAALPDHEFCDITGKRRKRVRVWRDPQRLLVHSGSLLDLGQDLVALSRHRRHVLEALGRPDQLAGGANGYSSLRRHTLTIHYHAVEVVEGGGLALPDLEHG